MVWFHGLMQIKKTLSGRRNGSKSLVGELQIAAVVLDGDGACVWVSASLKEL